MTHPVVWFEVLGQDGSRLQKYYADLFGWKIKVENGPMKYGTVDTGDKTGIPGGIAAAPPGTRSWVTFYVKADDLAKTIARATDLGGRVVMPPMHIPGGPEIAVFEDPEGHTIGLVKEEAPAPS